MTRRMTLAELREEYKKRNNHLTPLMLDNDSTHVLRVNEETDPLWNNAEDVFEMDPEELLKQALDLLGIPHEHV